MEPFEPPSSIQYEPPMNRRQNQGLPEPPLDDPNRSMGFLTAIIYTVQQIYFSPQEFFRGIRDDRSPVPAVVWAIALYSVGAIIQNLFNIIFGANDAQMAQFNQVMQQAFGQSNLGMSGEEFLRMAQIMGLLLVPIFAFLFLFFMVICHFLLGKLLGIAERSFDVYLRVVSYSFTAFIINLVPFNFLMALSELMVFPVLAISCFMMFHYVVLVTLGFKAAHGEDGTLFRPVLVGSGPFVFCCCAIFALTMLLVMGMGAVAANAGG